MALPINFCNAKEYFTESVKFFQKYQYLYNFANTDILVNKTLDRINKTDIENIDPFAKDFDLQTAKDHSFRNFFEKLRTLQVYYDEFLEDTCIKDIVDVPLNPKKKHEIIYLTKEIKNACQDVACDTVVDFGSGLGYLDQLIFETTNCNVLGLECNENHYVGAKKRQRKYHETSLDNVKYIKHRISEESQVNIKEYLNDKFPNHEYFCITGLHACADLTISAMNIFIKMAEAKALILMPCCYHKMCTDSSSDGLFKNFPLSHCLKILFKEFNGFEYMRIPFLRLGAQPSNISDKLEDLVFNLLSRAVLQLYAHKNNCKLKRNKRKAVKIKTLANNFENYIQDASKHGFTLLKDELSDDSNNRNFIFDLVELRSLWRQISDELTLKKAGIFILMQNYLQPVIENFILFDRLIYLKENKVVNCGYKKIFNERISPRCLALLAYK